MRFYALACCLLYASVAYSQIPTQGLLANYAFNGNSSDVSGNANDLTNHNAIPAKDRFGKNLSAYRFDGSTSYMRAPFSLLPCGDHPRTLSLFVKASSQPSSGYIAGWGTLDTAKGWYFKVTDGGLTLASGADEIVVAAFSG